MRRWFVVPAAILVGTLFACADGAESIMLDAGGEDVADTTSVEVGTVPNYVVAALQESLSVLGYEVGPIDGLVGPKSRDALADFQSDSGLEPTGELDGATTLAMAEASEESLFYVVEAVQTQLAELGYYTGLVDGVFGLETGAALAAFHEAEGIAAGAVVSEETLTRLTDVYVDEVLLPTLAASGYELPEAQNPSADLLRQGDENPEVEVIQERLTALGYRPGSVDGRFGGNTTSAVLAFQKREGLSPDGVIGPAFLEALEDPSGAGPRPGSGSRIEVDLDRQIAFILDSTGEITTINISSGSGREYTGPDGSKAIAYTPTGEFTVERAINGIRKAPLGSLYRPLYFKEGWAIHGSPNVPAYPASHGCIRTSNYDQDFVFGVIEVGDPVSIHGTSFGNPGRAVPGF